MRQMLAAILILAGCTASAEARRPHPHKTTTTIAPTTTRATTTTKPPSDVAFFEDFTGDTMADFTRTFDWSVLNMWPRAGTGCCPLETWQGQHNEMCQGPDTERTLHHEVNRVNVPAPEFWLCAPGGPGTDHLMTTNGANDHFGVTAFSPKQSFMGNRVCWDVNLTESPGRRRWWEVQLLPADAVANARSLAEMGRANPGGYFDDTEQGTAFLSWGVGLNGTLMERPVPSNAIVVDFTEEKIEVYRGLNIVFFPGNSWETGVRYVTQDRATRAHHCLTDNGNGTLTISQQRGTQGAYVRTFLSSFPKPYRVIFSDQNYDAGKDGSLKSQTWHWDNIEVGQ